MKNQNEQKCFFYSNKIFLTVLNNIKETRKPDSKVEMFKSYLLIFSVREKEIKCNNIMKRYKND